MPEKSEDVLIQLGLSRLVGTGMEDIAEIIEKRLSKHSEQLALARQDACSSGFGFLMISPDGSAKHISPTDVYLTPDPPKPDLSDKGDPRFQMFRAGKEARDDGLSLEHAPDVTEGEHRQIWINGWVGRDTELRRKS